MEIEMGPAIISAMLKSAKMLWGVYKDIESKNKGRSPEQLKARLDSLDDVVRQNFHIIEKLSTQIEFQKKLLIGAYLLSTISIAFAAYIALK